VGAVPATSSLVLDAGALIAIEKGDRKVLALCKIASDAGSSVVVPAGVVGQVWRDGARQVPIARIVGASGTVIEPLDLDVAKLVGSYCGRAATSDVIDATVVIAARHHQAKIISSDESDLKRLDPGVDVVVC
jgi:predicted nucleic acid-binding protein